MTILAILTRIYTITEISKDWVLYFILTSNSNKLIIQRMFNF